MAYSYISIIIIFLSSVAVGMALALIFRTNKYHGPNAINHCKPIYRDTKTGKCWKFNVRAVKCPDTLVQKIKKYFIKK